MTRCNGLAGLLCRGSSGLCCGRAMFGMAVLKTAYTPIQSITKELR
jgi:hypothetical protein